MMKNTEMETKPIFVLSRLLLLRCVVWESLQQINPTRYQKHMQQHNEQLILKAMWHLRLIVWLFENDLL